MSNELIKKADSIDKIDHFRREQSVNIRRMLVAQVGKEQATKAAAKIGQALAAAVRNAPNPDAIMSCSQGSIIQCVAAACAVDLYPRTTNSPVWLVPKGGELQFWMSHIGIATLAQRAGIALRPVAVHLDDEWVVNFGDIETHTPYGDPKNLTELAGVYVVVKRISDGALIGTPWVPISIINKRREQGGPAWKSWPIEMAMKTAIKYLVARGVIVIDLAEMAVAMDNEPRDIIDDRSQSSEPATVVDDAAGFLGLTEDPPKPEPEPDPEPKPDPLEDDVIEAEYEEAAPEPEPKPKPTRKRAPRKPRGSKGAP